MGFSWKNFDVTLQWTGAWNVSRVIDDLFRRPFVSGSTNNQGGLLQYHVDNTWNAENPSQNAAYPRATWVNATNNYAASTLYEKDASYLRLKSSIKFTAPVIKKDEEVHEDDEIKSQEELTSTKVAISIADVKGNDEANGADIADLKQVVTQAAEPEKVFDMVEQMPTFPGGQQELMSYLGKNIKYPTIAQENGTQGRVIIQFVVERDGSISDVHVARGVDPYLDKEAVRVVKSMPKWLPGKQNGKAVRVKFTVPVMFRLQ
jgi:TonB family protein